jgi:hypothetical protein
MKKFIQKHVTLQTFLLLFAAITLSLLTACKGGFNNENTQMVSPKPEPVQEVTPPAFNKKNGLDFIVTNRTGATQHITAFSYIKKHINSPWRWDKSPIYTLADGESTVVDIDVIPDKRDRNNVYGYLGVFEDYDAAENSTYQHTPNNKRIDLDLLQEISGKEVSIEIKHYGIAPQKLVYSLSNDEQTKTEPLPELDFAVRNTTGKSIYATAFFYEQEQGEYDLSVWKFSKTPVYRIEPGETIEIDVTTIKDKYDWKYMRGYLGVFSLNEELEAHQSTYETLKPHQKISLGRLSKLRNHVVTIMVDEYGISDPVLEHAVSPKS